MILCPLILEKEMVHLVPLRLQISSIDTIGLYLQGHALHDLETVTFQTDHFARIVGQEANLFNAQIDQDLRSAG